MIDLYCRLRANSILKRKRASLKRQFGRTLDDEILRFRIEKLRLISGTSGSENIAIFCIRFSPNYRFILATSQSGHVSYYDPKDGTVIDRITAHSDAANSITFLNENQFFTDSDDKSIKLWDVRNQEKWVLCLKDQHTDWVKNVNVIDDKTIVSGGFDGKIISWDLSRPTEDKSVESKVLFTGCNSTDLQDDAPVRNFLLRTAYSPLSKTLFMSFLLPECMLAYNNFDVDSFDETFLHDALQSFESHGLENYPYRSLYKDDLSNQSVSLLHNWQSLYREEKPIIQSIEPHKNSPCMLIRSTHGPADDYKEFTSVIDTSIETHNWSEETDFVKVAKRAIPFTKEEPISRDDIIRECNFSDCGRFIASPYGVGCRLLAFDEHYSHFNVPYEYNKQKELHDVTFKFARLNEKIITSYFSSYLCQLACGTSAGTIQLYSPEDESTEIVDSVGPNRLYSFVRRKRKYPEAK